MARTPIRRRESGHFIFGVGAFLEKDAGNSLQVKQEQRQMVELQPARIRLPETPSIIMR